MAAKLTRLTHKIAIQLHLVADSCIIAVLAPGGQSGNFWIHPRMYMEEGEVGRMGELRSEHKILAGKPEGKISLWRTRSRWGY
jgi:hypothetical protein